MSRSPGASNRRSSLGHPVLIEKFHGYPLPSKFIVKESYFYLKNKLRYIERISTFSRWRKNLSTSRKHKIKLLHSNFYGQFFIRSIQQENSLEADRASKKKSPFKIFFNDSISSNPWRLSVSVINKSTKTEREHLFIKISHNHLRDSHCLSSVERRNLKVS